MHEVCIGHLKNPTPGACGWLEPGPRPDGNQPRIAPHGRVTPRVSQPLCAAAGEEVALQIAQGDDRMWLLRAPPPLFTRAGTQVEAESGRRPREMWLDQRLSHGEGSRCGGSARLVTASVPSLGVRAGTASLGSAVGKQPEDPCCGSG